MKNMRLPFLLILGAVHIISCTPSGEEGFPIIDKDTTGITDPSQPSQPPAPTSPPAPTPSPPSDGGATFNDPLAGGASGTIRSLLKKGNVTPKFSTTSFAITPRLAYIALDAQDNLYVPVEEDSAPRGKLILKRERQTGEVIFLGRKAPPEFIQSVRGIAVNNQNDLFWAEMVTNTTTFPIQTSASLVKQSSGGISFTLTSALKSPEGIALMPDGRILVADAVDHKVVAFSPDGSVKTTIAGTGIAGDSGDGGPATNAQLTSPKGIRLIGQGIFICQENGKIRAIDASGVIRTVATGFDRSPSNIAFADPISGFVFIASPLDHIIMKTNLLFSSRTIVAGTQFQSGASGDGGLATEALLSSPTDVGVDSTGIIYIGEAGSQQIRIVFP